MYIYNRNSCNILKYEIYIKEILTDLRVFKNIHRHVAVFAFQDVISYFEFVFRKTSFSHNASPPYYLRHVSVQCTVYNVQCTMYSVQCTVYNVQCTMYSIQCTVYSVHCTLYSVQCTLYSVQCTVYNVQCIMYSVQCTVYNV